MPRKAPEPPVIRKADMLPAFAKKIMPPPPVLTLTEGGTAVSGRGCFECGSRVEADMKVCCRSGISAVVMRVFPDGQDPGVVADPGPGYTDLPFEYTGGDGICSEYRLLLDTEAICGGRGSGLFFYEYLFLRGGDTLFSSSSDNVHFSLSDTEGTKFRLLIYERGFDVPDTGCGIMYHIFVDRFFRGYDPGASYGAGARLRPASVWKRGIPSFAAVRGEETDNLDFYGGNLEGVREKLGYLKSLGVTMIYLSPVFSAPSNHKYDTSDYTVIDSGFGGRPAFDALLSDAKEQGIGVILDGVFNHTGADSVYFDAEHRYGPGAESEDSPYHSWYRFGKEYKNGYESWWDIRILPRLRTDLPEVRDFFTAPGGIAARYIAGGASGWRLDVADELPDEFLEELRKSVKKENRDALIIGEVWENAADKVAYGRRRKYFRGRQLDSVMNYPFRRALIRYATDGCAVALAAELTDIYSSYPPAVCDALMNIVGTHDTARILSCLGDPAGAAAAESETDNRKLASMRLTPEQRRIGIERLKAVSVIQYTVYGFPCVYYGDETGMEGMSDPFCRAPMKWGSDADAELLEHYRRLGRIRRSEPSLAGGSFRVVRADGGYIEYEREKGGRRLTVAVNLGDAPAVCRASGLELYGGTEVKKPVIGPRGFALIVWTPRKGEGE